MPKELHLAVFPGDGIGPEVTAEATGVLRLLGEKFGFDPVYHVCEVGDAAKLKTRRAIPPEATELFSRHRLALKGPVGENVREFVDAFRVGFGLYVNLRPIKSVSSPFRVGSKDFEIVVVREGSEGIYRAIETEVESGVWNLTGVFSRSVSERLARFAFDLCEKRKPLPGTRKVTVAHKANVLKHSHGMFLDAFRGESSKHRGIAFESLYADAAAAYLVSQPERFDVLACDNLIGDILSDVAAEAAGGLGLAGSANLNPETGHGLFEPVHGSAPDIAGRGIADPIAAFRCVSMLLDFASPAGDGPLAEGSLVLERAIADYLRSADKNDLPVHLTGKASTRRITEQVVSRIRKS